jgi:hypothetical protein
MQIVDASKTDDALYLGQVNTYYGMIDVLVSLGQVEHNSDGIVQVTLVRQEVSGLLLAMHILDELIWVKSLALGAVDKVRGTRHGSVARRCEEVRIA